VRNSKSSLEDALGVAVNTFAYPFGQVDERVRAAVGEAGYTRAYTVDPGRNWFNDPLLLKRTEVEGTLSMMAFAHKVKRGASPLERIAHRVPARAMRVLRMLL
jgi:peptidoglycan/xylan/chitin deacetylase (PgdA/CDA1 family)